MLDETVKLSLEIKGDVLKNVINDLNADRNTILNNVLANTSNSNDMMYVSTLEGLIRQLVSYQSLLENSNGI